LPIQTYVTEISETLIEDACKRELARGGQVLIVYNRVETIYKVYDMVTSLLPNARVGVAHGQMPEKVLEDTIMKLYDGEFDILVATTLIESGIDLPLANTLIVLDADRLGLAQLYQLRGRIGRSDKLAYAYFTYNPDKVLTQDAYKRLDAIMEFTELGSGFKIAMRDLEIRGAGNVLGKEQHGHMEKVGYDMYCKLLDEVVKEIRGEEIIEEVDVQIELDVTSYIPEEYIENAGFKIEVYQNIALCKSEEDIENVTDEIIDRFGQMPYEVENLLDIARIKILSREKSIFKVAQRKENVIFYFDNTKFNFDVVEKLMKLYRNRIKFSPSKEPYITFKIAELKNILEEVKDFLNKL
jgi:transcription-repair coupling factor (superfamily II helicase)